MVAGRDPASLKRLERTLVGIRWFGVAFGLFQVIQVAHAIPHPSREVQPVGYSIIALLALGNLVVMLSLGRLKETRALTRLGLMAFALDTATVFAFVWLFAYDRHGQIWVLLYVLPLEGAIRYQLRGALLSVALAALSEAGREWYRVATLPDYPFYLGSLTFRVGIDAMVGLVAGFMARSLAQEAARADERADQFEDLALRETTARKELAAFHATVMAGVAAEDFDEALQSMVEEIGATLDLETLLIGVIEDELLRFPAAWGLPPETRRLQLHPGEGITGRAWAEGRPILVEDVQTSPAYIESDPAVVSELAVPLRVGSEILGVLDVQSREAGRLTEATLELMTRFADQVALIVNNARALKRQRDAIERLRELDDMKSDFVAITSHELRTPLTAIRGFVDTLRAHFDRFSPEERKHFLDVIDEQGRKLSRLLEDLLVASKIEAGHMTVRPEEVAISELVTDLVGSFEAQAARINVHVIADGRAYLDPHRTSQVLRNLVQNALKFSPKEAAVDVEVDRTAGHVDFTVRDHGIGIPANQLDRIFERFHQAGDALTREQEGAGLGLYISKRLVEAMGGRIEVHSNPGEGSEFRVSLPSGEAPSPTPAPAPPPSAAPAG